MASGAEYRVVFGSFIPVTEYQLSVAPYNKVYSWEVSGNIITKGYDYKLTATGKKTVTLESGTLKATTKEDIIEEFYALELIKQKYQFIGEIDGGEEENPQTGDESLWVLTFGGFSMIGLAATASYLKK